MLHRELRTLTAAKNWLPERQQKGVGLTLLPAAQTPARAGRNVRADDADHGHYIVGNGFERIGARTDRRLKPSTVRRHAGFRASSKKKFLEFS